MSDGTQNVTTDKAPVTVIGLGLMGHALAGALVRADHPTTVWNRTAGKADDLVAQGATLAGSARDAIAASPLTLVCVSGYDAAHGILDPAADLLDGRVVVNLSSGTSRAARETAQWAATHGATYLDGAIMSDPGGIGGTETLLLYSGPRTAFDQHAPTLRSLGGATTYLGDDHGLASLYDVALLGMMWSVLNGFLHGAALLGATGVRAADLVALAKPNVETVASWLPGLAGQIDDGAYPADDATIGTHLGAMDHLIEEAELLDVDVELPRSFRALAERAVADGRHGESYAAVVEQFRKPSTPRP